MPFNRTPGINEVIFASALHHTDLADDVVALADMARVAFALGMVDAFEHRTIKDSFDVMRHLFPHGWTGGQHHRVKFRMVYGAGHAMASTERFYMEHGGPGLMAESHLTTKHH